MSEIPESEIDSMCLTWRHDFGLPYEPIEDGFGAIVYSGPSPEQKDALRSQMRQLYVHHVLPAILAERERCANVAEELYRAWRAGPWDGFLPDHPPSAKDAANAIRNSSP